MVSTIIWPWWVRLSHWLTAAGVLAIWVLTYVYYETDALHRWLGCAVLILVMLRIGATCFAKVAAAKLSFPSRKQLVSHIGHLKQRKLPALEGHNPLGQLAVYVIWALIALLALTGWLSRIDQFWGEDWPVDIHSWLSSLLMAIVVAHVVAVFVIGRLSRQHLILQMLHGKRHLYDSSANERH